MINDIYDFLDAKCDIYNASIDVDYGSKSKGNLKETIACTYDDTYLIRDSKTGQEKATQIKLYLPPESTISESDIIDIYDSVGTLIISDATVVRLKPIKDLLDGSLSHFELELNVKFI